MWFRVTLPRLVHHTIHALRISVLHLSMFGTQLKCHLAPLLWREGRHQYSWYLLTKSVYTSNLISLSFALSCYTLCVQNNPKLSCMWLVCLLRWKPRVTLLKEEHQNQGHRGLEVLGWIILSSKGHDFVFLLWQLALRFVNMLYCVHQMNFPALYFGASWSCLRERHLSYICVYMCVHLTREWIC